MTNPNRFPTHPVDGANGYTVVEYPKSEGRQLWGIKTPGGLALKTRYETKGDAEEAARSHAALRAW